MIEKIAPKIIIAGLLLLCLLRMPYAYYQFMRITVCILFIWMAYNHYQAKQMVLVMICVMLVVLFNPVIKLTIHKRQWQTIDFWLAIALLVWVAYDLVSLFRQNKSLND